MLIRTDTESFDTDELVLIERVALDHVVVILKSRTFDLRGQSAKQAWAGVNEQAEILGESN